LGILTQPTNANLRQYGKSYIAASYVKFVEAAGARVVPVFHNSSPQEITELFNQINGVLLPGGGSNLHYTALYYAAELIYNLTVQANKNNIYFPLQGHCMGFELIHMIASRNISILTSFDAENIALPLDFEQDFRSSRLFATAQSDVVNTFSKTDSTMNNHFFGVSPESYKTNHLDSIFQIISTNKGRKGRVFVSTAEHKSYPIYSIQWHAEKPIFEWWTHEVIPHDYASVFANRRMADFLVSEARKNTQKFANSDAEDKALIYNYRPYYTAKITGDFEQCYIFDK